MASRYGSEQLVHRLLDAGAWLETDEMPVYDNNSPFYLASAYGHYGIIEKLFVYQPSMCNTTAPLGEKQLNLLAWLNEMKFCPAFWCLAALCIDRVMWLMCEEEHCILIMKFVFIFLFISASRHNSYWLLISIMMYLVHNSLICLK